MALDRVLHNRCGRTDRAILIMTTLRHLLPLRLLRAATAVIAAVLLLLGAMTLQNLAAHTDDPVASLTGAPTVSELEQDTSGAAHVDQHEGVSGIFCALLGLAALVMSAGLVLALLAHDLRRPLFSLSRVLARLRPRLIRQDQTAVSLTVLSIARV